jgi:putative PIN family toxin of toxin-antitoxin system
VRKVVFDTNIYNSAFITPGGRGEAAYRKAVEGGIQLFSSVPILTELAGKLQGKFTWDAERVKAAVRHVAAVATVLKPEKRLAVLADDPDNRILECAVEAGAEAIVTGDRYLLDLGTYERIEIVTLAVFLERTA